MRSFIKKFCTLILTGPGSTNLKHSSNSIKHRKFIFVTFFLIFCCLLK